MNANGIHGPPWFLYRFLAIFENAIEVHKAIVAGDLERARAMLEREAVQRFDPLLSEKKRTRAKQAYTLLHNLHQWEAT